VPLELLLGVGRFSPQQTVMQQATLPVHVHPAHEAPPHHDHDHSHLFHTWSWQSERALTLDSLRDLVNRLPTSIYRAKGIIYLQGEEERSAIVQVVGRRGMIALGAAWGSRPRQSQFVVIGSAGGVDPALLTRLFDAATLQPASGEQRLDEPLNFDR
jgi:G3E family GTPase